MRNTIVAFLMIMILLLIAFGGEVFLNQVESLGTESTEYDNHSDIPYEHKIDLEHLAYYGLDTFSSKLPIVYIDSQNQQIIKENKKWAFMAMDNLDTIIPITINLRGASSYSQLDKEQYRITFYENQETGAKRKYPFLGMTSHSDWVLHGPVMDKTLMRNHFIYELAAEIFDYSPESQWLELFVDGRYKGVYLATETIDQSEERLDLNSFGLLSGETPYILKRDRIQTEQAPIYTYGWLNGKTNNSLYIEYPSQEKITPAQEQWITDEINEFEAVLYSEDFLDPEMGYTQYIDMDNFVDYYIFNEVVMNKDAGNLSTYIYKNIDEKLRLTLWDYNNAYDNYTLPTEYDVFCVAPNSWFDRLLMDRNFVDQVITRYEELRNDVLSIDNMYGRLDTYEDYLQEAIARDHTVWQYTLDKTYLFPQARNLHSHEEAMKQLKEAIHQRFEFLDTHLTDLYDGCIN